jgi:hypothetical protein
LDQDDGQNGLMVLEGTGQKRPRLNTKTLGI